MKNLQKKIYLDDEQDMLKLTEPQISLSLDEDATECLELEETSTKIDFFMDDSLSQVLIFNLDESNQKTARARSTIEARANSILSDIIKQRNETKALPLALRKRLMYQKAVGAF